MTGNGQVPAVVPPMGVRGPLGGGAAPALGVGAPAPQQQFAPVPPVQPQQVNAAPPWAATPAQLPPSNLPPEVEQYIAQGLQAGAPLSGPASILQYFPQATEADVRAIAQKFGLTVNEAPPQVQPPVQAQPVQPMPPIAAAMAPQAQISAQVGANEQATDVKPALRVTKKHHPLIQQALEADPNATAEQIAAALHIPLEGTRKVLEDMRRELALKTQFGVAAPAQDAHTAAASAMMQSTAAEAVSPVLPPQAQRVIQIMVDLQQLAQARGYDYLEIESVSAVLSVQARR